MLEGHHNWAWYVIGKSIRGASHERTDLPNQDAIGWLPESGQGTPIILAVADGHGSAKSFRSDRGARFAVDTARKVANAFLDKSTPFENAGRIEQIFKDRLVELVRRWQDEVDRDLKRQPFSPQEIESLQNKAGAAAWKIVEANPVQAYGATLLIAVATTSFILFSQLGDGDILIVSESGAVSRPVARDPRLIANETTSLSSPETWRNFRTTIRQVSPSPPALILLSTDGYANSFRSEQDFLKIGPDIWRIIQSGGINEVNKNIETWLVEASRTGSGDDITLGLITQERFLNGVNQKSLARLKTPAPSATAEQRIQRLEKEVASLRHYLEEHEKEHRHITRDMIFGFITSLVWALLLVVIFHTCGVSSSPSSQVEATSAVAQEDSNSVGRINQSGKSTPSTPKKAAPKPNASQKK